MHLKRAWLVCIVLVPLVLAACAQKPESVVRDFYEAFEHHDFSKAKKNACASLHDELDVWQTAEGKHRVNVTLNVTYTQTDKSKDQIWYHVTGTKRELGETFTVDYLFRVDKEDGWKVCAMQAGT